MMFSFGPLLHPRRNTLLTKTTILDLFQESYTGRQKKQSRRDGDDRTNLKFW
jgi:hypothetical protein